MAETGDNLTFHVPCTIIYFILIEYLMPVTPFLQKTFPAWLGLLIGQHSWLADPHNARLAAIPGYLACWVVWVAGFLSWLLSWLAFLLAWFPGWLSRKATLAGIPGKTIINYSLCVLTLLRHLYLYNIKSHRYVMILILLGSFVKIMHWNKRMFCHPWSTI
jgi:hypothetical protein